MNEGERDRLITEMHGDIKVVKEKSIQNHDWLRDHEGKLETCTKEITKIKTIFLVVGSLFSLAWFGLLAFFRVK